MGEKSSKFTLVAPRTIIFRVRIWQVAKVVVPLNNTRTKRGRGGILSLQVHRGPRHPRLLPRRCIRPSLLVLLTSWCRRWWMKAVGGSGSGGGQRRTSVLMAVDGERQAGGFLPCCCWRWQGNRWRTMDDGRRKNVGGRQNYLLTKSWER